jgi:ABC-type uncharacterized transport system substrate-binding protein
VIVASATPAAIVARQATQTVPIVFVEVNDPVGPGLVTSLAHPGGNVTGVSTLSSGISGKRVELFHQALPNVHRVAVIWYAANPCQASVNEDTLSAATQAGLEVHSYGLRSREELESIFNAAQREHLEAVLILPAVPADPQVVVRLAVDAHVPVMYSDQSYARAGGLMSFGTAYLDMRRRAATYVDKILRGTRPSDLPVQQPDRFEFIVNLSATRALGLDLPDSVLLQATELIR